MNPSLSKRIRWLLVGVAATVAVFMLAVTGIHWRVVSTADGRVYQVSDCPPRRVALVLGAGVLEDGSLSYPLRVRMEAALKLYQADKVEKILVSGDNRWEHYNEPARMREWLIDQRVPGDDVVCDYAGRRTLDSCARAAKLWNLNEIIVVTQRYHLPRALYLAKAWGMNPVGVSADGDGGTAGRRDRLREIAASIVAWLDVNVFGTQPALLGNKESI